MTKDTLPYIFDIQRFSIHDGPGIRTVVFTKGCPLKCSWCQNPESQKSKAEVAFYSEKCNDCKKCIDICPTNAINSITKISNFLECIGCGACVDACPNDARRMIGTKMIEEEVAMELLKDIDFYLDSNGGITFSGGEPFMYPEFIFKIIANLKKQKLHITIETCGQFDFDRVSNNLSDIDLIYFDLKHLDSIKHKLVTGVDNFTILNNFKKLKSVFDNIQVRIPLIPGVNDGYESIKAFCDFLLSNEYNSVHLLPYHSLGNSKAIRIDYKSQVFKVEPHSEEELNMIKSQFEKFGINPFIYD